MGLDYTCKEECKIALIHGKCTINSHYEYCPPKAGVSSLNAIIVPLILCWLQNLFFLFIRE